MADSECSSRGITRAEPSRRAVQDCWEAWGHLRDGIDTPYALPFDRAHGGTSYVSFLSNHPHSRKVFVKALPALNSFGRHQPAQRPALLLVVTVFIRRRCFDAMASVVMQTCPAELYLQSGF